MKRILVPLALLASSSALAASDINDNFRLFEDTSWVTTFALMVVFGLLMRRLSANYMKLGFTVLTLAGLSGFLWKAIGVVKRVFMIDQPEWLFEVARESFEAFAGLLLGVAFLILAYAFIRIFSGSEDELELEDELSEDEFETAWE